MARRSTQFVCQSCGAVTAKWQGRCESCGEWNSIVEEQTAGGVGGGPGKAPRSKGRVIPLVGLTGDTKEAPRILSGLAELDRVTGGGFVRGSALLVGGDPGIGKSTLLIQAASALANLGHKTVYISGEEAVGQVRLRAERLGLAASPVALAAETSVEDILATLEAGPPPALVILDSIQTLWTEQADSPPGTVTQVRASAQAMVRYAKKHGTTLVLVGHVTKDGQIAGPRVVEHMVDAVLYFEGDGAHQYRILRSVKNRFGATDEIGVFEMTGKGLSEVANPSALFLGDRTSNAPGSAVFAGLEGSRPLLIEIQALVAQSSLGTPRRAVIGWDNARLSMILAVLEARCGVRFSQHDVYLNVAGGLKIAEPGADLAVAAALVSSLSGLALPANCVYFGEVSLSGAIRPVAQAQSRLKEAQKLGFDQAYCPDGNLKDGASGGLRVTGLPELGDFVAKLSASAGAQKAS
ncbi:DNA replication and repair protein RadA [Roseibium hamelinense]|uniref:DNA repair protein RadA n=1 Tax=Roseibium hamelinense TaxID=150831 RepID=A0A562TIM2_9HYPH|nr:DNA repair protein RadA [Roseibium hamelinense]MTI42332.1 DNA repair protein RadA [Roseibium hamelinense]TWI93253.1 DNA replication and repair protein RadA [Roseibium hamelinense]